VLPKNIIIPEGGDKQRKAEKKRRTWVLRNGRFQLGHTERGENRRGGMEMQAEAATAMRKRKKRDAERTKRGIATHTTPHHLQVVPALANPCGPSRLAA
jgi:hypothetical protein